jgi:hypothetical protein
VIFLDIFPNDNNGLSDQAEPTNETKKTPKPVKVTRKKEKQQVVE